MTEQVKQYVDPTVSRVKFDREIVEYRSYEASYRPRGWFLVNADWPVVVILMASNKTNPPVIVLAVRFDYTNYDAEPPSVRLVDPFTERFLLPRELSTRLPRAIVGPELPIVDPSGNKPRLVTPLNLMQAQSDDSLPFLCIAGVKEYHDHPGHSGDPWELHRSTGAGRLVRLLEVISKYGLDPVRGFNVAITPQMPLSASEPPQ